MMTNGVWLVVGLTTMAFAVPGPCSYDAHQELDCDGEGADCPAGLACASDGFCKPEDVACDSFDDDDFPGGAEACDGVCVARDSFETDTENCGGCGNVCDAGLACCGGECVALDVDGNCGACGVTCTAEQACVDSGCRAACDGDGACAGSEVCCDSLCRDGTSADNCGACGEACGADEACVTSTGDASDAACVATCDDDADCPGSRCCGGFCTAPGDPEHCGACDAPCGADLVCIDDACAPECADDRPCASASESCCDGRCVDTDDDDDHCGGCNAPCAGTTFCDEGTCRTGNDRDCCGSACVDCGSETCTNRTCQPCDIYEQNCGPLASCSINPFVATPPDGVCVDALPPPAPDRHETCTGACLEGLDCSPFITAEPTCAAYCDPANEPAACLAEEHCLTFTADVASISVCVPQCDPAVSTTCALGNQTGTCFPRGPSSCSGPENGACLPPGTVLEGGACQSPAQCAQGLACDAFGGVCAPLCGPVGSACDDGGTCTDLFGCTDVGVCR